MANCLHSQAHGIHPGAYYSPEPPDTTDAQDGILWINTSGPAPYPLMIWNATEGSGWQLAGHVPSVYVSDDSLDPAAVIARAVPALWVRTTNGEPYPIYSWDGVEIFEFEDGPRPAWRQTGDLPLPSDDAYFLTCLPDGTVKWFEGSREPGTIVFINDDQNWEELGPAADTNMLTLVDGLPAWGEAPKSNTNVPIPPVVVPMISTCTATRCGASQECMQHLLSLYQNWSNVLDPIFQTAAAVGVVAALATLPEDWVAAMGIGSPAIFSAFRTILQGFVGAITGNLLPALTSDMQDDIHKALFDVLTCEADTVGISALNTDAWRTNLNALTTWPVGSLAGPFCALLVQFTPLLDWQQAAARSGPLSACDSWS